MVETTAAAKQGASVAKDARVSFEKRSGKKIVTPLNAKNLKELKGGDES